MVVVAKGKVGPASSGSKVVVTLSPPLLLTLALVVGLPLLTLLALAVSAAAIVRREPVVLLIWTMPSVLWSGIVRSFSLHAQLAEDFFRRLLPAPAPPSVGPFR
jgi:positive regulator of sigma E activity